MNEDCVERVIDWLIIQDWRLTVRQKLGGPTHRVFLRFHKLTTTADSANDRLTITIFARKNLPAHRHSSIHVHYYITFRSRRLLLDHDEDIISYSPPVN